MPDTNDNQNTLLPDTRYIASPLERAGFNPILFREKAPLSGNNPYGKKSTVASQNTVEEGYIFRDNSVPTESILNRYTSTTNAQTTLTNRNYVVSCDTTSNAITLILPDARTVLGRSFIVFFAVDGGNNLTVSTDGTDVFQGSAGAGNDTALFEDVNDFIHVTAVMPNVWLVLSQVGGTYS